MDRDWGGTGKADKAGTENIYQPTDDFLPFSGLQVQRFIKDQFGTKAGYIRYTQFKDEEGYIHCQGFATEEDAKSYDKDPERSADLLLFSTPVYIKDSSQASYVVTLNTTADTDAIISTDGTMIIPVMVTSVKKEPDVEDEDTGEDVNIYIQYRSSNSEEWQSLTTIQNFSTSASGSEIYTNIDLTQLLQSEHTYQLKMRAIGQMTQMSSSYKTFNSVTMTNLYLKFATDWELPIQQSPFYPQYYIYGAINKTLHIKMSGTGGTGYREFTQTLTSSQVWTETPGAPISISDSGSDSCKIFTQGIHTIESWLTANDVSGVESEHITSEVLIIVDSSDTTPYMVINNFKQTVQNFTEEHIFDYAVYAKGKEELSLTFRIDSVDGSETYLTVPDTVATDVQTSFDEELSVESTAEILTAKIHVLYDNKDIIDPLTLYIDNTENFNPTAGADFYINPHTRSNNEENPETIINAMTGKEVAATFSGFGKVHDLWVTDDDGNKCLKVPAGCSVNITGYEAFDDIHSSGGVKSATISMTFKVADIRTNGEEDPAFRMCSYISSDNLPLGLELKPLKGLFMTQQKRSQYVQDFEWGEDERVNMQINIIYNLDGLGVNYVRVFINGCIQREFTYATGSAHDSFLQYVDGVLTSQGIRIGNSTSTFYLYDFRVYKKALSTSDCMQNHKSSLPTVEEKKAFAKENDILENEVISYEKVRKTKKVLVLTGQIPSHDSIEQTTGKCSYEDPDSDVYSMHNDSVTFKGQGTSSMGYEAWNLTIGNGSGGEWINNEGTSFGNCIQFEGVPKSSKNVVKVNWASSMQSHKIGGTRLFNDLHKKVVGGFGMNYVSGHENARTAVYEEPVFMFQKETDTSTPTFIGLGTWGSAKGDKNTFGYSSSINPEYLQIEGEDNNVPLVMHTVPWLTTEVIYDDETWYYNDIKSWSVVIGNPDSIDKFIAAFNQLYLHSWRLKPYNGTFDDLNADKSVDRTYQYWVTNASTGSAVGDVYSYDYINSTWTDAGINQSATARQVLNIAEQTGITIIGTDYDSYNSQFITTRLRLMKDEFPKHFHVRDALFHSNWVREHAGTDNRGKNTYPYYDTWYENASGDICSESTEGAVKKTGIRFAQDDVDTVHQVNNVGYKTKPYYVEPDDLYQEGSYYWESRSNLLYGFLEKAYYSELRSMMREMLSAETQLAVEKGHDQSVMGCYEAYYLDFAKYFPAIAFNMTAKIRYEAAQKKFDNGTSYPVAPISQNLGNLLESEREWLKRRAIYMSSWAEYGDFTNDGSGVLMFRGYKKLDGTEGTYTYDFVPHYWLYMSAGIGSSTVYGTGYTEPQRVQAGDTFRLEFDGSGDTSVYLHGIHYMDEIGDQGNNPTSPGEQFHILGDRLRKFIATGNGSATEFRPEALQITAAKLEDFSIVNCEAISGSLDFSSAWIVRNVDFRGTGVTSITYPTSDTIRTLHINRLQTAIELKDMPSLETVDAEGVDYIQSVKVSGSSNNAITFALNVLVESYN